MVVSTAVKMLLLHRKMFAACIICFDNIIVFAKASLLAIKLSNVSYIVTTFFAKITFLGKTLSQ
jgi:hypothetical protein